MHTFTSLLGIFLVLTISSMGNLSSSATLEITEDAVIDASYQSLISESTGQNARKIHIHNGATVILADLTILGGTAPYGAGLFVEDGSTVTLQNVMVTGNHAADSGGGLYVDNSTVTLINSTVSGNTAVVEGAGIVSDAGMVLVSKSMVLDDIATRHGGGIEIDDSIEPVDLPSLQVDPPTPEPQITQTELPLSVDNAVDPTLAVAWMDSIVDQVSLERVSPPVASRIYAYAGIALYEAVQPSLVGYRSLSGQLADMPSMPPRRADAIYDDALVLIGTMSVVAPGLFDPPSSQNIEVFESLAQSQAAARGDVVAFNTYERSLAHGRSVGEAILAWAATDNYQAIKLLEYTLPVGMPSLWEPMTGQEPMQPYWGTVRPFALPYAAACHMHLDLAFDTVPGTEMYESAAEVHRTVNSITDEQRLTAQFWADDPGDSSGTPPGHWVLIMNQFAEQQSLDIAQTLEMYALTGVAMGDAFISSWDAKYTYQLIRPITYIQRYMEPGWETIVPTPPFPEYPSGHSVVSAAASAVLTNQFGEVPFTDSSTVNGMAVTRQYASFGEAADEAAISRLYGGIHYDFGIENGLEQGACVGESVMKYVDVSPR